MCDTPTSFPLLAKGQRRKAEEPLAGIDSGLPGAEHRAAYDLGKRFLDVLLTSLALPLVLPLFPLLMVLVKCGSPGPVFYRHLRVGRSGQQFYLYKFRTMRCEGEAAFLEHLARDPQARAEWERRHKLGNDPRVTPLGRVLRKYSLDELPQLLHVLTGEMTLVGPRPITEEEIRRYGEYFYLYTAMKPGLTGLWQVSGRGRLPYEHRVALDVKYATQRSLLADLRILLRTPVALRDQGEAS